jgi:hypothetical protein
LLHVCGSDCDPDHLLLLFIALQGLATMNFVALGSSIDTATQGSTNGTDVQGPRNDTTFQGLVSLLQRLEAKVDQLADSMRTGLQEVNERLARLEAGSAAYVQQ